MKAGMVLELLLKNNMTYKQFNNIMTKAKELCDRIDKDAKVLHDITGGFPEYLYEYKGKAIDLLLMAIDKDDIIDYYIYERDWGKEKGYCITHKDGKKFKLDNNKQLYNYLKDN